MYIIYCETLVFAERLLLGFVFIVNVIEFIALVRLPLKRLEVIVIAKLLRGF